jgi:hypothetical protein
VPGDRDHPVDRRHRQRAGRFVEPDDREGDAAVGGDLAIGAGRERALDRVDVGQPADQGQRRFDPGAGGGRGDATRGRRREDDLVLVPALGGEAVFERIGGGLRLGARQGQVVGEVGAGALEEDEGDDEEGRPDEQDAARVSADPIDRWYIDRIVSTVKPFS